MAKADGARKTIAVRTTPSSPPEVPRISDSLAQTFTTELPERMISNQAYQGRLHLPSAPGWEPGRRHIEVQSLRQRR
jgi:hypothetical protein